MEDDYFATKAATGSSAAADPLRTAFLVELQSYRDARGIGDWRTAWYHLERAHILAQPRLRLHMDSHVAMLTFAFSRRDVREISGQLLRIALVPLGALSGRLPGGNTGRARVSAFIPMPVPEDLQPFLRPDAP